MKIRTLLFGVASLFITAALSAQDVKVLEGGAANGGIIETTINAEAVGGVNKIYELKRGQFYLMHAPINVDNTGGTLTIRAEAGDGPKPVIIRLPLNEVAVGANVIKGSFTLQGLQIHWRQTDGGDGGAYWNLFSISENNSRLVVEDCMFEMGYGVLFNTDGVENGQVSIFRNNYFRDFHDGGQWWAGRVINCKVPIDSMIYENNTSTGAGLTVLGQECMMGYGFINHNTFINNTKYPFLNQYWKECYYTNNLFVNANWVGEDHENVATGGQDPDALLHGLVGLDTITVNQWLDKKYLNADSTALTADIDQISDYIWYAADNVCVSSTTLNAYYTGTPNDGIEGAAASYLNWGGLGNGPWRIVNAPGIFMNERTEALINDWDNIKAENNIVYEFPAEDMGFGTDPLPQAAADVYIDWNRSKWGVPGVTTPDLQPTRFGDWDANTIPGVETENSSTGGITKISDVIEDFSYSKSLPSNIDGKPIGALHWVDMDYDPAAALAAVKAAYSGEPGGIGGNVAASSRFELKNYPNPFANSTTISFNLSGESYVSLKVYDVSGRMVDELINERMGGGVQTVEFAPGFAGNSTYFYKLTTDFGSETRKMMLLK
ncbi:MAG: T9SS type A sorting domain-containing protein [Bacteroidales bacterium]